MKGLLRPHLLLLLLVLLTPAPLWAAAGKVVIATGDVFAVNAQEQRRLLQRRSDVFEGDTLITGADGTLQLRFEDNAILALRANSQLRISEYHGADGAQGERVLMDLLAGGFRTISGSFGKTDRDAYQVRTPTASIGIRGTHYEAVFDSNTLSVGVYEGGISVTNELGTINLGLDSDFLYAQVQSGALPQGLLNPPANLNVPNTPQADAPPADDGEESDEASDDESDGSEEAPLPDINDPSDNPPPSNNPDNTNLPIPDADDISDDDFNFSAIEDDLDEKIDQQDPNSVVALTTSEINALKSDVAVTGILVFAPGQSPSGQGPIIAYSAQVGGQNISNLYVAYETQNGTELDGSFYLPNLVLRPDGLAGTSGADEIGSGLAESVNWEHWDESVDIEVGSTSDFDSGSGSASQFFFIQAEPTQAKLSGTMNFSMCDGCFAVDGMGGISEAAGGLKVDFQNLDADGFLQFQSDSGVWEMGFEGDINGTVLNASLVDSVSINWGGGNTDTFSSQIGGSDSLSGNVSGIFTGTSGAIDFVGGFSAENGDGSSAAYGIFTMDQTNGIPSEIE
ncbi:FecR family protein [Saccharospirillum mangrovi]|uniref:FecR family protein n=1 Tax=Saccharospirillum mangrovi TaxID=2161747 RepID=UPI000D3991F7|nr:FecR family protein [Saccharospirillum mangrovi]